MLPTVDAAIDRVRAYARAQNWNNAHAAAQGFGQLAETRGEEGFSASALRDFFRDGWAPNVATLRRMEALIPADFNHAEAA